MPQYDLAGNPLPEPDAPAVRLDLAGNPLPPLPSPPPPLGEPPAPTVRPLTPSAPFAPPPGGTYGTGAPHPTRPAPVAPAESGSKLWIGLTVGGVAVVIAILLAVLMTPRHATIPTAFTTFTPADKSFSCDQPVGWTTKAADKGDTMAGKDSTVNGVLFQSNSAQIDITTDSVATLISADLMKSNGDPQSLTGDRAGVLHKQWKVQVSATHKGYSEKEVVDFEGGMGGGHLAEWTSGGNVFGLGGRLHGYRASLAGGDKTAEVVCECLESDWPALQPVFLRVIKSVGEGGLPASDAPAAGVDTPAPPADAPAP